MGGFCGSAPSPGVFLWLFVVIALVNYMDRGNVNATLTNIEAALKLSKLESGYVASAFMIGYVGSSPVFAMMSKTTPAFKLMGYGLVCFVVGSALSAVACIVGSYPMLLLTRGLVGVGEASFLGVPPPPLLPLPPLPPHPPHPPHPPRPPPAILAAVPFALSKSKREPLRRCR